MKLKQLVILTLATLCCTALSAKQATKKVMFQDSIQSGDTYLFIDTLIDQPGDYSYTFKRTGKPDSIVKLSLKYITPAPACEDIEVAVADSILEGDTYLFIDTLLTTEGTYTRTIPRVGGCDSTINLTLSFIVPPVPACEDIEVAVADSILEGDTYLFIDTLLTTEGTYTRTIPRVGGCDSTINLTLSFIVPPVPACEDIEVAVADSILEGDTYLFIDTLLTTEGTYTRTIPRVGGCDSTINLTLSFIVPPVPVCTDTTVAYVDSIYVGDTYLFIDTLITPIKADTVTCQRTIPREGTTCDSIINLTLIAMHKSVADTLYDTTAVNRCYKEAFTDRLNVTYYPTQDTTVLDTIVAARVEKTETSIITYDSIYVFEIKVWPAPKDSLKKDTILVDLLPYTWQVYEGRELSCDTAGTYRDTLDNGLGCDSIRFTLELKVIAHDTVYKAIQKNLCNGEVYSTRLQTVAPITVGDTAFNDTVPGIMMEPLLMRDSIYQYTLSVWPAAIDSLLKDTILEDNLPYKWKPVETEHQYYVADTYHDTADNILGCDSIRFTLELKVIEHDTIEVVVPDTNLCDGAVYASRWQELTMVGRDEIFDTTFNDTVKSQMIEPLQMNDTIYKYHLYVWPKTKYPEVFKDTIDEDKFPYTWNVYEGRQMTINEGRFYSDTVQNILHCDSIIYRLELIVRVVERREAEPVDSLVCKGTEYQSRLLPTHTINGLTEWQDSLRVWDNDNLLAIDSIYTYTVDIYTTQIPSDELTGIEAFCDYTVDYGYAWLNVAEYVDGAVYKFAAITDTIWEVETTAGWQPAATTVITSGNNTVRIRCTVVTECETTITTSAPFEVKMATADDKEELTIPASQKYGNRIIMVDKNATEGLGWTIPEADVVWYKVVGDQDDRSYNANPAAWNDQVVKEGSYYVTRPDGNPLEGSYYALISGAKQPGMTCGAELRTKLLVCEQEQANAPKLTPNMVAPAQTMELSGLNATKSYTIRVVAMNGGIVGNYEAKDQHSMQMKAATISGMYIVNVISDTENVSLKYIVK